MEQVLSVSFGDGMSLYFKMGIEDIFSPAHANTQMQGESLNTSATPSWVYRLSIEIVMQMVFFKKKREEEIYAATGMI